MGKGSKSKKFDRRHVHMFPMVNFSFLLLLNLIGKVDGPLHRVGTASLIDGVAEDLLTFLNDFLVGGNNME